MYSFGKKLSENYSRLVTPKTTSEQIRSIFNLFFVIFIISNCANYHLYLDIIYTAVESLFILNGVLL